MIYDGTVVKTTDFGAFVNFFGAKDGLVHISQLAANRVNKVTDVVKEGDKVKVKLLGFDERGKVRLSMKVVDQTTGEDLEKKQRSSPKPPPASDRRASFVSIEGGREAALFRGRRARSGRRTPSGLRRQDCRAGIPALRCAPAGMTEGTRALTPSPPLSPHPPRCHPILRRVTPLRPLIVILHLSVIPGLTRDPRSPPPPRAGIPALRCAPAGMTEGGTRALTPSSALSPRLRHCHPNLRRVTPSSAVTTLSSRPLIPPLSHPGPDPGSWLTPPAPGSRLCAALRPG